MHKGDLILLSHKKNEILPFAITWREVENVILIEISQRQTNTVCYHLYVESKKYTCMCNWVTMLYNRKKNCIGEVTIKKDTEKNK